MRKMLENFSTYNFNNKKNSDLGNIIINNRISHKEGFDY
jgi:hypothetical protein